MKSAAICSFLALVFIITSVARTEVIYTEDFDSGTGDTVSLSSQGWGGWNTISATDKSTSTADQICVFVGTSPANGKSGSDGRYFMVRNASTPALITTAEVGSVATSELQSVSFVANHSSTSSVARVVAKIGDNWYATSDTFSMLSAGDPYDWDNKADLDTFTWTNAASAWRALNFTPASTLTLGDTITSDLSGDVTEFGVYFAGGSDMRIDDFKVSTVPEPATALLAIVGLVPLLVGARLRRRLARR